MNDTEANSDPSESSSAVSAETPRREPEELRQKESGTPSSRSGTGHIERVEDTPARPREIGGRKGPDPVRYGDWEKNGRCIDF